MTDLIFNQEDLINQEDLSASPWIVSNNATLTTNDTVGPLGAMDAATLEVDVSQNARSIRANNFASAAGRYTCYIWVMAGTVDRCDISIYDNSHQIESSEIIMGPGTILAGSTRARVRDLSDSWTLVRVVTKDLAANNKSLYIYPYGSAGASAGNNIHIWRPKAVAGEIESNGWRWTGVSKYADYVLNNLNPAAYWPLDDEAKGSVVSAVIGPSLAIAGPNATSDQGRLIGSDGGTDFGTDTHATRSSLGGLIVKNECSVMGWARADGLGGGSTTIGIFGIATSGNDDFLDVRYQGSLGPGMRCRAEVGGTNKSIDTITNPLIAGEWNHWAIVVDGGTNLKLYQNGIVVGTTAGTIGQTSSGEVINIGNVAVDGSGVEFVGAMQGWSYHHSALNQKQIQSAIMANRMML